MESTTVRVRKHTQEKLKKLSAEENTSIADFVDKLIDEHGKTFWKGFAEEAKVFLDKEERRIRNTFENTLGDGFE